MVELTVERGRAEEGREDRRKEGRGVDRLEERNRKANVMNSSDEHHSDGSSLWKQIMKISQGRNIN